MSDEQHTGPATGDLSYKLNRLFATMHPRGRGEYTLQEVIDGIRAQGGPTLSITYLWQLRHGVKDNPTKQHLEALAQFFGVNPAYFFDRKVAARVEEQLDLLAAMRDAGVYNIAQRASELDPGGRRTVTVMIEELRRMQGLPTDPPPRNGQQGRSTPEEPDDA